MSVLRHTLTPAAISSLLLGWLGVIALAAFADTIEAASPLVTWLALAAVVAVILVAAFGVVAQAEALAHRLGDPYGSLILTISIVLVEVILIASVLLGPGEHATIARDSVMAVTMIILGLVVGLSLLIAPNRSAFVNRRGTTSYIVMIIALAAVAFVVPFFLPEGTYTGPLAFIVAGVAIIGYGLFLARQMGPRAADYREYDEAAEEHRDVREVLRNHGAEVVARTLLLIATAVPIIIMSHDMSTLMDTAFTEAGAPLALSGVVIAFIVFTPETITTLRAARAGELQRVVNLCLGALVSTVGLTIPVVLVIGEITGSTITLAPDATQLLLMIAMVLATILAFWGGKTTRARGVVPVLLFAAYFTLIAI
ncbi:calcium:proton antiporter [Microbacterium sp. YY-03]|uniref:calcium:proton antiporter n=1 Tax=Microbacterium sp. YY-03 TaxID=3421636 RepID=UPI003D173188